MPFESTHGGCLLAVGACFKLRGCFKVRTLNEKDLLPFSVPFCGNLRSVDVLRSLYQVLFEFFLKKLRKYGGACSFKLLKTIVLDSMSINLLVVFHPCFSIN